MASDNELIDGFLDGDRGAFDELVVRHQKQVFSTAYRMVGNAETAEEIAQETFIRAFKGLRSFRRKAGFNTWLYRITMNLCYTELKRRKREIEMNPGTGATGTGATGTGGAVAAAPHEKMAQEERKMWLERQMETLPFKQRSALALRIFQGMSFGEIGRAIGCTAGSARVNYRHAMLKLKDALTRSGEEL